MQEQGQHPCQPQKSKKHKKDEKGKIHNFEVMICTLDQRLLSLVTGVQGANTFPMRKQLLNPHFQNTQTFVFLVFLTFSSNKHWWRLRLFSPLETNALAHLFQPFRTPTEGQIAIVGDSTRDVVRKLGHSIGVQLFYHDFSFVYVPSSLLSFGFSIFVYNLCYDFVFGCLLQCHVDLIHAL